MSNKPFYQELPEWACSSLNKRTCSQCDKSYDKKDIIAVGIRPAKEGDFYVMYLEHKCSKCKFRALTTMGKQKENTLEKLCYTILEGIKKKKIANNSKSIRRPEGNKPITDGEVKDLVEFMNNNKTHADFLKEIGVVLPEDKKDDKS